MKTESSFMYLRRYVSHDIKLSTATVIIKDEVRSFKVFVFAVK